MSKIENLAQLLRDVAARTGWGPEMLGRIEAAHEMVSLFTPAPIQYGDADAYLSVGPARFKAHGGDWSDGEAYVNAAGALFVRDAEGMAAAFERLDSALLAREVSDDDLMAVLTHTIRERDALRDAVGLALQREDVASGELGDALRKVLAGESAGPAQSIAGWVQRETGAFIPYSEAVARYRSHTPGNGWEPVVLASQVRAEDRAEPEQPEAGRGQKIAPPEPTETMMQAAFGVLAKEGLQVSEWARRTMYQAMFAAMPGAAGIPTLQPIDPDGEIVRAGFREFYGPGLAVQHTRWQVWRSAVEWCMSCDAAPAVKDSLTAHCAMEQPDNRPAAMRKAFSQIEDRVAHGELKTPHAVFTAMRTAAFAHLPAAQPPAQAQPERKLAAKARVGNASFGKGLPERMVIDAAIRAAERADKEAAFTPDERREEERNRRAVWDMINGPLEPTSRQPLTDEQFVDAWVKQTRCTLGNDKPLLLLAKKVTEAAHGIQPADGCGACGDACAKRAGGCRLAEESPAPQKRTDAEIVAQPEPQPLDWHTALKISELPEVDEAIRAMLDDPTEDNSVGMVQAIVDASRNMAEGSAA